MQLLGLEIKIQRSTRKTVSIYVERDGQVSALVPEKLSDDDIIAILKTKEYQIHKNLADWKQLNEAKTIREYTNGQSFLYLGRNYRLYIEEDITEGLQFYHSKFLLAKSSLPQAKELFVDFYKSRLLEKLPQIVNRYQKQIGVEPKDIKVMDLQNRWASCTAKGNLNFHWKCSMASVDVLHYIVIHELVHLIHRNHTPEFWNELDKHIPNYQKHIEWLRRYGAGMDL